MTDQPHLFPPEHLDPIDPRAHVTRMPGTDAPCECRRDDCRWPFCSKSGPAEEDAAEGVTSRGRAAITDGGSAADVGEASICPDCGRGNPAAAMFCRGCATSLDQQDQEPRLTPRQPAPGPDDPADARPPSQAGCNPSEAVSR